MIGDGHPALGGRLEDVLRDTLLAVVEGAGAVERDPHPPWLPGQGPGHAVAIAADLDVGVPGNLARLPVGSVIAPRRQGPQRRSFPGEALGDDLADRAMHPRVGLLPQPLLGELVEVGPTLEGPGADKKVVLDVADVAFVFPLRLGAGRPAGPGAEPVVAAQIEEARMELDVAPRRWASTAAF